jgi:hypothetical protein
MHWITEAITEAQATLSGQAGRVAAVRTPVEVTPAPQMSKRMAAMAVRAAIFPALPTSTPRQPSALPLAALGLVVLRGRNHHGAAGCTGSGAFRRHHRCSDRRCRQGCTRRHGRYPDDLWRSDGGRRQRQWRQRSRGRGIPAHRGAYTPLNTVFIPPLRKTSMSS